MSRRLPTLVRIVPVIAVAAGLAACSAKPENSPVIRKKFAEVDEIKDQLDESSKLLRNVAGEITLLRDEVSNLRALTPGEDGAIEVVSRLDKLEQRLDRMNSKPDRLMAQAIEPARNSGSSQSFQGLATGASENAKPKTEEKKTVQAKPAPEPEKAKPVAKPVAKTPKVSKTPGKYYTLKAGDSLQSIAKSNGISVKELAQANRLPAGARPLKGQRIYIPGK